MATGGTETAATRSETTRTARNANSGDLRREGINVVLGPSRIFRPGQRRPYSTLIDGDNRNLSIGEALETRVVRTRTDKRGYGSCDGNGIGCE
jgi:hypothetical protein